MKSSMHLVIMLAGLLATSVERIKPACNGKFCRVKTCDVSYLHRAPRKLNVGGFHARSQQDIIDVFIWGQGAVYLSLG